MGINAAERGDDDEAVAYLQRAAAGAPEDHRPHAELAAIALRRSDVAGALTRLDQAVHLEPHDYELRYRRAVVLAMLGRHAQAEEEQQQAARLRAEQDRVKELRDRLARSPGDAQLRYEIASWLIANGHEEEGLRWAELVARERPDHGPTNRLLADYYDRRGQAGLANYYRLRASPGPGPSRRRAGHNDDPAGPDADHSRTPGPGPPGA
jgi:Flp pilus assembly protein TadD